MTGQNVQVLTKASIINNKIKLVFLGAVFSVSSISINHNNLILLVYLTEW